MVRPVSSKVERLLHVRPEFDVTDAIWPGGGLRTSYIPFKIPQLPLRSDRDGLSSKTNYLGNYPDRILFKRPSSRAQHCGWFFHAGLLHSRLRWMGHFCFFFFFFFSQPDIFCVLKAEALWNNRSRCFAGFIALFRDRPCLVASLFKAKLSTHY